MFKETIQKTKDVIALIFEPPLHIQLLKLQEERQFKEQLEDEETKQKRKRERISNHLILNRHVNMWIEKIEKGISDKTKKPVTPEAIRQFLLLERGRNIMNSEDSKLWNNFGNVFTTIVEISILSKYGYEVFRKKPKIM